jgi:hypothetical protein
VPAQEIFIRVCSRSAKPAGELRRPAGTDRTYFVENNYLEKNGLSRIEGRLSEFHLMEQLKIQDKSPRQREFARQRFRA